MELTRANIGDTVSLEYYEVEILDPDAVLTLPLVIKDEGITQGTGINTLDVVGNGGSIAVAAGVATLSLTGGVGLSLPTTEAAGRNIVNGDIGKSLKSTANTNQTFNVIAGLTTTAGFEFEIIKIGTGNVTVQVAVGITLNGVDNGTTAILAQYDSVTLQALDNTGNVWRVVS
jgi:hypothetical protein